MLHYVTSFEDFSTALTKFSLWNAESITAKLEKCGWCLVYKH